MNIFEKWNKKVDTEGLRADVKEAEQNGGSGEYKEVPEGKYEVKIDKMEIKESSKGDPMFFTQFRIINGDYKNSCLFMNQVILQGFQIGRVNRFLRDLTGWEDIEFVDYEQYNDLIMDAMEECEKNNLEFLLKYSTNKKGFPAYTIEEVYDS